MPRSLLFLALSACAISGKDISENNGYPDLDSDSATPAVPGTTVTVGDAEADTDGCDTLGSEENTHKWTNAVPLTVAEDGSCSWVGNLGDEYDVVLDQVVAYGYGGATAGPSGATFWNRTDSAYNRYLIPAEPSFVPEDLEDNCFDVTAGGAENASFRWGARDHIHLFDGHQECLEVCNGGAGCADVVVAAGENHEPCKGTYTLIDPTPGGPCGDKGPVGIDFQGIILGNDEAASAAANGASGSGIFMLLPTSIADNDGDGDFHARLLPIMLSGSGKLTANAVIDAISSVTIPSGGMLRLLHDGTPAFRWAHDDSLVNAGSISTSITGAVNFSTPNPKAPGVFVGNGIPASSLDDYLVSMSWTTITNSGPTLPQGWSLKLQDIGCSTYKQYFTVRRMTSPERVTVEPYGFPSERRVFPATHSTGTTSFDISYADLHLAGQLQSMSSQGATLVLSTMTYSGSNVCSTGTYSMAPE